MSDYETIQRRRNVIVGIFVVAGMCALGWLVFKFGDMPGLVSQMGSYEVFVRFPKAPGVQRDTPVRFCGYQIGSVTAIQRPRPMEDLKTGKFYHQTLVVLSIDDSFSDIPDDVNAVLLARGFGSSYIELQLAHYDVNEPSGPVLGQNSELQGSTGVTSEFFPEETQKEVRELIIDMRTFVNNANDILGDPTNKKNVKRGIEKLADVSAEATARLQEAKDTLQRFNRTLDTIWTTVDGSKPAVEAVGKFAETATRTFENTGPKAEELITSLTETSEQLAKSLSEAQAVLAKINSGEGSAGRFVNDAKLYETLVENIDQVELLLKEIKAFVSRAREKGVPIKLK
ncbi:MAG: MCE family protein [Sedimentisphaerales bacterium]|nr:MCE family protein [Sedimentisphaerales bacterium]